MTFWLRSRISDRLKKQRYHRHIQTPLTEEVVGSLRTGDMVFFSGEVYTARDVAHGVSTKLCSKVKTAYRFSKVRSFFYAAPTPTPPGKVIGSIGPTTSYRMDFFTPKLIENGLKGMIGKGSRSPEVIAALQKYGAVYFGAIGGIAALVLNVLKRILSLTKILDRKLLES